MWVFHRTSKSLLITEKMTDINIQKKKKITSKLLWRVQDKLIIWNVTPTLKVQRKLWNCYESKYCKMQKISIPAVWQYVLEITDHMSVPMKPTIWLSKEDILHENSHFHVGEWNLTRPFSNMTNMDHQSKRETVFFRGMLTSMSSSLMRPVLKTYTYWKK